MNEIGKRIAELRKEHGMSQEQLSEETGIHRVLIGKYETGKNEPSAQSLKKMADALGVSTDLILGRTTPEVENALASVPQISWEAKEISKHIDAMQPERRKKAFEFFMLLFGDTPSADAIKKPQK